MKIIETNRLILRNFEEKDMQQRQFPQCERQDTYVYALLNV